jgi:hypothetical protein
VGAQTVRVLFPYDFRERSDVRGLAGLYTNEIFLGSHNDHEEPYPKSRIEQTFIHELMHFVSEQAVGEPRLFEDEAKHDAICNLIYLVFKENKLYFGDKPCKPKSRTLKKQTGIKNTKRKLRGKRSAPIA